MPHSFAITVVLLAIAWWYLRHTAGGRHFFAIGGDPQAARLAGVRVQRRVMLAYVITGLMAGLGACFIVAQGSNLGQNVGTGKELAVIAAVVIGGTSIMGGRGSVLGTLARRPPGADGRPQGSPNSGGRPQLSDLFVGAAIIVAVGTDLLRERARRADEMTTPTLTNRRPAASRSRRPAARALVDPLRRWCCGRC